MKKSFEMIAEKIQMVLPKNWSKVCLYAEIEEDSYEMFFYCFLQGENKPIQCYNLEEKYSINEDDIDEIFYQINQILKPEWLELKEKEKDVWSNLTFILNDNGEFFGEYDYSDLSNGSYDYKKEWKNKYLK